MGGVDQTDGVALVQSGELVALVGTFHNLFRQLLSQLVEVDGRLRLTLIVEPLRQAVREEFPYASYAFIDLVGGLH